MMPGMIMLWHGSVADIPSGWHLCDGTMGTPDLHDMFVLGVKSDTEWPKPGSIYGTTGHKHTFTGSGHSHTIPVGTGLMAGEDYALETETDSAVGETSTKEHYPKCRALCYIMKL